jgi:hypothetical protein
MSVSVWLGIFVQDAALLCVCSAMQCDRLLSVSNFTPSCCLLAGFDPFGFSNSFDVRWLREAELKHGRVCMLAVAGIVGTTVYHLPGDMHNVGVVAAHDAAVQSGAMSQILLWTGIFEVISIKAISEMLEGSGRAPGDFGFDPFNIGRAKSDAWKEDIAVKELKNGRLAMMAFGGIITQAVLTGKEWPFA